jgi:hypothetical protein
LHLLSFSLRHAGDDVLEYGGHNTRVIITTWPCLVKAFSYLLVWQDNKLVFVLSISSFFLANYFYGSIYHLKKGQVPTHNVWILSSYCIITIILDSLNLKSLL